MVLGGKCLLSGTKVPGNERFRERIVLRTKVPSWERMFQGTNSLENEYSSILLTALHADRIVSGYGPFMDPIHGQTTYGQDNLWTCQFADKMFRGLANFMDVWTICRETFRRQVGLLVDKLYCEVTTEPLASCASMPSRDH